MKLLLAAFYMQLMDLFERGESRCLPGTHQGADGANGTCYYLGNGEFLTLPQAVDQCRRW